MNKRNLKWIALGAVVYFFWMKSKTPVAAAPSQTFDPVHNSDWQFNDFQYRFGQDSTGAINPASLFNGDIQSTLGYYTDIGETSRMGFDVLTMRSNNIPIV